MTVRWLTGFIDRPPTSFEAATRFWAAVTGSTVSEARGETGEFATLIPPDGDPYLRVQRVADGLGGTHIDLHAEDVDGLVQRAIGAGASQRVGGEAFALRSPAGLPFCIVAHRSESRRPRPLAAGDADAVHLTDQVCIDIPRSRLDEECAFWSEVTGWELRQSSLRPEFSYLVRPEGMPLRLLLQRRDDERPIGAHLDVASSDLDQVVSHHEHLGATVVERFDYWTVLTDPAGIAYCVTARDPATGTIASQG